MAEIRALGLAPQVQEATAVGTRYPAAGHVKNIFALRAGAPLEHAVIALFTDAEESGLLGAAAFVREHPWARVLATLDDVTASSLSVTIYRSLPNDTDLSELSLLGTPALNFAFVDVVERYHTFG